ncbi:MAG: hypothetical protein MUO26_15915 [Methanotrichaceae archaeon]|nr:hypothetical protein [Methanotrichaceae archaeon]
MKVVEARALMQLSIIETIHEMRICDKNEVAQFIAKSVDNPKEVLFVCVSINSWIACNKLQGNVIIPLNKISALVAGSIKRQL